MSIVAKVSRSAGPMFFVASDGRVMGAASSRELKNAKPTGVRVSRKPRHLYYVDAKGNVHEKKAKGA